MPPIYGVIAGLNKGELIHPAVVRIERETPKNAMVKLAPRTEIAAHNIQRDLHAIYHPFIPSKLNDDQARYNEIGDFADFTHCLKKECLLFRTRMETMPEDVIHLIAAAQARADEAMLMYHRAWRISPGENEAFNRYQQAAEMRVLRGERTVTWVARGWVLQNELRLAVSRAMGALEPYEIVWNLENNIGRTHLNFWDGIFQWEVGRYLTQAGELQPGPRQAEFRRHLEIVHACQDEVRARGLASVILEGWKVPLPLENAQAWCEMRAERNAGNRPPEDRAPNDGPAP